MTRATFSARSILRENWLTFAIVGALLLGFFALRTTETDIASLESFDARLKSGGPTVVYFYSNL